MQATDFWGEIGATAVRTPLSIMREQAAALGPKTQYLVTAKVETQVQYGDFIHSFDLQVPSLDGYTYRLFQIQHGASLYPVREVGTYADMVTEAGFVTWLRDRLSAEPTKKIVSNLLAQARS